MKISQTLLALLFVALVAEIVVMAPGELETTQATQEESLQHQNQEPERAEESTQRIEQAINGVHSVDVKDGKRDWELWARQAVDFKQAGRWALDHVKVRFFTDDGGHFEVTGLKGIVDLQSKDMMIEGDVLTRSSNGYLFKTDRMTFRSHDRSLYTPSPVEMRGPREAGAKPFIMKGKGLTADLNRSTMEIKHDVRGKKQFKDGRYVHIKSRKALFSTISKTAQFLEDVIIDVGKMRVTGQQAQFQYSPSKKMITQAVVQGHVRVNDQNKWATAKRVDVNFLNNTYVFTGHPKVMQNNDELFGRQIIFYGDSQRVEIRKARAKVEKSSLENYRRTVN